MMKHERGLTLLEVMVALVVLSLVGLGYLELFQGSHRLVAAAREWSQAGGAAAGALERALLRRASPPRAPAESLPRRSPPWSTRPPGAAGLNPVQVATCLPARP